MEFSRRSSALSQLAERYAIMIFEVCRKQFAYDFKFIEYDYEGTTPGGCIDGEGTFSATFTPFERESHWKLGTKVIFHIQTYMEEDQIFLTEGKVFDLQNKQIGTVRFAKDGEMIAVHILANNTFHAGNSPRAVVYASEEELLLSSRELGNRAIL
jgi:hypothetical protein